MVLDWDVIKALLFVQRGRKFSCRWKPLHGFVRKGKKYIYFGFRHGLSVRLVSDLAKETLPISVQSLNLLRFSAVLAQSPFSLVCQRASDKPHPYLF